MARDQLLARPVAGRWSTREVVCHVCDAEQFFADRIKRTLAMSRPLLLGADPDHYPEAVRYHDRDPEEELARFRDPDHLGRCRLAATGARIEHGGNKAVYIPDVDFIRLPAKQAFERQKEYYSTALHELPHWPGHESRLARLNRNTRFGSEAGETPPTGCAGGTVIALQNP